MGWIFLAIIVALVGGWWLRRWRLDRRIKEVLPQVMKSGEWVGWGELHGALESRGVKIGVDRIPEVMYRLERQGWVISHLSDSGQAYKLAF